jgi:glycosyltransferase involved in cell wall biosynthesis
VEGARKHAAEVLVVDDGSVDRTIDFAKEAGARVISIPRNTGKGHALSIGLTTAALNGSDIVVCLDSDGQHDPDDIPRIVEPIADGRADMVIGSRFLEDRYRAFRRDILRSFDYAETGMGIESEMVRSAVRQGFKIEEVPITAKYEGLDTSTLKPGNHGMSVLGSVVREIRSEHPLLYFGVSGLIMTIVGVVLGLYSIEQYISMKALPFGPSLLAVMLTALGILFMLVGLILNAISQMVADRKDLRTNGR